MEKSEKQKILEELGGITEDFYNELLVCFISQTQNYLVELRGILGSEDFARIAAIAHSIKGSSANLRLNTIQQIAREIEVSAKEKKDKVEIGNHIQALEAAFSEMNSVG
ncbi:MAG: Hpt domain-containing protein [Candidatus Omnitrophota bacterium]|jgi:HPt (histidine-containing phosphotransfer) domain-containing protein